MRSISHLKTKRAEDFLGSCFLLDAAREEQLSKGSMPRCLDHRTCGSGYGRCR